MTGLDEFLSSYQTPLIWVLALLVFMGFLKGVYTFGRSVWKALRRGVYDFKI